MFLFKQYIMKRENINIDATKLNASNNDIKESEVKAISYNTAYAKE